MLCGLAVGSFVAAALVRGGDDAVRRPQAAIKLDRSGDELYQSLVTKVNQPVTFAIHDVRNTSALPVRLVSYRALEVPRDVKFLGDGVFGEDRPFSIGGDVGYPPQDEELRPYFRALDGHVLRPFSEARGDRGTQLLLGFRPRTRGHHRIDKGLRLTWIQEGRRMTDTSTYELAVCALSAKEYARDDFDPYAEGEICSDDAG